MDSAGPTATLSAFQQSTPLNRSTSCAGQMHVQSRAGGAKQDLHSGLPLAYHCASGYVSAQWPRNGRCVRAGFGIAPTAQGRFETQCLKENPGDTNGLTWMGWIVQSHFQPALQLRVAPNSPEQGTA